MEPQMMVNVEVCVHFQEATARDVVQTSALRVGIRDEAGNACEHLKKAHEQRRAQRDEELLGPGVHDRPDAPFPSLCRFPLPLYAPSNEQNLELGP